MSRTKTDLSRVTLNQLETLTGKNFRALKKALADVTPEERGGSFFYDPTEALPIIYGIRFSDLPAPDAAGDDDSVADPARPLDPVREKALLDRAKRRKVDIEIQEKLKKLIPAEKVAEEWGKMVGAFRSKLLNLPKKLAPKVCATKDVNKIEKILTAECHEALQELAGYESDRDSAPTASL
jgi:hypothetical protein